MTAYLGPAGGLVPFRCPSAVEISTERAMSYLTTLGGRVKVQRGPVTRRQWQVGLGSATPSEIANLQALVEAGTPPWVWADPYAQVTNMFTPEQSTLAPGTWFGPGSSQGGAVLVEGSNAPRTVVHADGGTVTLGLRDGSIDRPAVVPGVPVSASLYARGAGALTILWHDSQGALIGSTNRPYEHATLTRVSATNRMPPAGAVAARLVVTGARQVAMPCISWTVDAPAWSIGRGCTRAVAEGLSESVQIAVRDSSALRRSALTFTVREVG